MDNRNEKDAGGKSKRSLGFYIFIFLLIFAAINAFAIFFLFNKYN